MNSILILSEIVISFSSIIYLNKKYKKEGLYLWLIIAIFLGNIMVTKTIRLSGFDINLGIIIESTIFIVSNIIIQKEGKKEINKIIFLLLLSSVFSYIILCFYSLIDISTITPIMDNSYNKIFITNLSLYLANNISLLIALKINSHIYYKVKTLENKIWVSNTLSMIISQFINILIFGIIYLTYEYSLFEIVMINIIRFLLSVLTISIGTILIYYLKNE